ncbi:MAG: hypothetical protein D6B28_06910 [Gammaproteobacteria bacterium]|nr:MAG: hypothetical protein D6B28_06910 [Gammaproteobacteria bacterium]
MFSQLYCDLPEINQSFLNGFDHFNNKNFHAAIEQFTIAMKVDGKKSSYFEKYLSFISLCEVLNGDRSSLNILREITSADCCDADIYCNLAIAEFISKHRRRAFAAIDKGQKIGTDHNGLNLLYEILDTRRPPAISFLNRDNPINVALGKLSYRLKNSEFKSCDEYLWSYIN